MPDGALMPHRPAGCRSEPAARRRTRPATRPAPASPSRPTRRSRLSAVQPGRSCSRKAAPPGASEPVPVLELGDGALRVRQAPLVCRDPPGTAAADPCRLPSALSLCLGLTSRGQHAALGRHEGHAGALLWSSPDALRGGALSGPHGGQLRAGDHAAHPGIGQRGRGGSARAAASRPCAARPGPAAPAQGEARRDRAPPAPRPARRLERAASASAWKPSTERCVPSSRPCSEHRATERVKRRSKRRKSSRIEPMPFQDAASSRTKRLSTSSSSRR